MNVNVMNGIQERNQIHGVPVATTESTMLGKDDFLKLLIAQLQNQDPLDPMDDREFIAQMAQFSSLEQMTNMNAAMQKLSNQQESAALVQHSELIGKNVTYYREIEDANGFPKKSVRR
ncbi:flagellar hook assembly protein FlgD [Geomicrobium sp. JCM 19055]|uniref:flagellar hook assembly protein FlgD n=1 Tax=Geomicrobium sp. JCM 19055 TaxID=1460649 RepID=UPI0006949C2C|nr:flagellar hook assembly protein FlgD [Geomicrobium sp. JCM 19055]